MRNESSLASVILFLHALFEVYVSVYFTDTHSVCDSNPGHPDTQREPLCAVAPDLGCWDWTPAPGWQCLDCMENVGMYMYVWWILSRNVLTTTSWQKYYMGASLYSSLWQFKNYTKVLEKKMFFIYRIQHFSQMGFRMYKALNVVPQGACILSPVQQWMDKKGVCISQHSRMYTHRTEYTSWYSGIQDASGSGAMNSKRQCDNQLKSGLGVILIHTSKLSLWWKAVLK